MTYIPDQTLVHTLATKVIDGAIEELRDTGAMDISEIGADELDGLPFDQQDAVIQAVRDTLRDVPVGYALPGRHADLIEDAICRLYAAGHTEHAAAVRHLADHQSPTATDWVDTRDNRAYPLDSHYTDTLGDTWAHDGWATYLDNRQPVPLMRCQGTMTLTCLITDLIGANRGHLTAARAGSED